MNYRIKEQYGFFFIEKEVEYSIETRSLLSNLFPIIFKPKVSTCKRWSEITQGGYVSGLLLPSMKFKTKEAAQKAISNLKPKYHDAINAE